jgi:hypothetical protein
MSIGSLRRCAALALGTASAAVIALAGPAGASTGTAQISPAQAGYTATGAQFKEISAGVYARNPAQYARRVASFGHSVQLWSAGMVVTVGVTASTSGQTVYTPYAAIYNRSTHQVIASNPNARYCKYRVGCFPGIDTLPFGNQLSLRIRYDPATGHLDMFARNPGVGSYGADFDVSFSATVNPQSFTQARVGTDFGRSPWDASYTYTPPASSVKIAGYFGVKLTSYSGHTATLVSWWVHHKLLAQPSGRAPVATPGNLSNGGASCQTWFVPKSA